jgi:glycosyltransferase involved in cell wall biosynthesis
MSGQYQPLITVVVAVYNKKATLPQCLDSVVQQTYPAIELIVIDGGSSDGTTDVLSQYSSRIAYCISEPDRGIYDAWNKALAQAHGEWVCFLGADDFLWDRLVLARVVARLEQVPAHIDVAYSQVNLIDENDEILYSIGQPWNQVKHDFRQLMCIPHPAVMHRSRLFKKHGVFDESFHIAGDYELLSRELFDNDAFYIPDIVFSGMRQGGVSSAPANTLVAVREVRAAQRKNGLRWPGAGWLLALTRAYLRWVFWSILGERPTRILLDCGRRLRGLPRHWTKT